MESLPTLMISTPSQTHTLAHLHVSPASHAHAYNPHRQASTSILTLSLRVGTHTEISADIYTHVGHVHSLSTAELVPTQIAAHLLNNPYDPSTTEPSCAAQADTK